MTQEQLQDIAKGMKALQEVSHEIACSKGWHDKGRTPGDYAALFHSEVSEFFEELRTGWDAEDVFWQGEKPRGPGIELADILIRVADYAELEGLDLGSLVELKSKYNQTREFRHGGKLV